MRNRMPLPGQNRARLPECAAVDAPDAVADAGAVAAAPAPPERDGQRLSECALADAPDAVAVVAAPAPQVRDGQRLSECAPATALDAAAVAAAPAPPAQDGQRLSECAPVAALDASAVAAAPAPPARDGQRLSERAPAVLDCVFTLPAPAAERQQLPLLPGAAEASSAAPCRQLPLVLAGPDVHVFETYLAGQNAAAVDCLLSTARGDGADNIYLWGGPGAGKSHLLQAACNAAARVGRRSAYVPLMRLAELTPGMFLALEDCDLVCLDDVDRAAGDPAWETAVFDLFNRLRDAEIPLVMSACLGPGASRIQLPDLKSRLAWGPAFHLRPLDEALSIEVLKRRARSRGLDLSDRVVEYLLRRVRRDAHNLLRWLDRLDARSLAAQKRLTVDFVRRVLGESQ